MKKIIAAALSVLIGAFGFTIVDKTIEQRVSDLEYSVSSLVEENNSLSEKTYKVGDEIEVYVDPVYRYYTYKNNMSPEKHEEIIFDEFNVTAKIVDICTDPLNTYFYNGKYTIEFSVSGIVNKNFYNSCKIDQQYYELLHGRIQPYGFAIYTTISSYIDIDLAPGTSSFSTTFTLNCQNIQSTLVTIGEYTY